MNTSEWALLFSLLSLIIATCSLLWNIWSKFIFPKPKVQVSCGFMAVVGSDGTKEDHVLSISAVNHGPIAVTLRMAVTRGRWLKRRQYGVLNPLHDYPRSREVTRGPFSGGLPKRLDVGEEFSVCLTPIHEGIASSGIATVGFNDTFGRLHWAPRKQFKKMQARVQQLVLDLAGASNSEI